VAVTGPGATVFADLVNNRVRLVPARAGTFFGRRMLARDIYTVAGTGRAGDGGDGGLATRSMLRSPASVALDPAGNVLLADSGNNRVRVVAAASGSFYGRAMRAGRIYTIAGTGRAGSSGDRGPATAARLSNPAGIAVDHHGNVVLADHGNGLIRVIAVRAGSFYGQSMRAGRIYTVAHLTGTGVAVDAAGNLVVGTAHEISVLAVRTGQFYGRHMVAGRTYVIAGPGKQGVPGNGGPATSAYLTPDGVAVDRAGNVVITDPGFGSDTFNGLIRVIAVKSGTYYGVAMKAGHIYAVAGAGSAGLGDGGPALRGRFNQPTGVTVTPSGALVVLDLNRIRVIAG
jgi:sugar lactone lactonase YvrE